MNDEQRNFRSDQPKAETELSADQHKAEKLAIENKTLRFVLDSIPDNISIKDLEGRYIFDNRSHCLFLGATNTEDVVGKTLFDFLPPRIAAKFHAEDLRILRSGEAVVQSVDESINRSGNSVWMSVTKMSLRDDKGELMGLVSTTRDITARKKAEEQLAKYAEELREKNAQRSLYRHCICWPTLPVANCTMQMRDTRPRFGFTGSGEALSRSLFTDRSPIRCSGSLVTQNTTARLVSCALETYCCFLPTGFSRSKGPMSITTSSSSC